MNQNNVLSIGDWVSGVTGEGELVHGFIEKIESNHEVTKVRVVTSDNDKIINKTVGLKVAELKKLPPADVPNDQQWLDLIDLALQTKDKQWFETLSKGIKRVPLRQNHNGDQLIKNRLSRYSV
ncbi:IDEAL domain-containing protein [Caldalkalibacillus salinus]|uniref:IDEAL domain-containing protein n=1 Tax=Caldalkalibacillus salinus TaxID=2803787 RepID=UPI001922DFB6|nr:IDEAL domain-containing protein [Caldalkalibacillus salinus]